MTVDFLIVGAGIVGLTAARALRRALPEASIVVIEKERELAQHASGRNSGVLHAGFYYSADSLKARFCVEGNRRLREFCQEHGLKLNTSGKLVIATDGHELEQLDELERRGRANGSRVWMVDEQQAAEIDPNAAVFERALYSPNTATVDPREVCAALARQITGLDVEIRYDEAYRSVVTQGHHSLEVRTTKERYRPGMVINCAGLHADRVAKHFGFGKRYIIIPFKGLYLRYAKNTTDVRTNLYPVPNLKNPFLGVHFTKTVEGGIKIGPTAIPAFWREQYRGMEGFDPRDCAEILFHEARLWLRNSFGFRSLAFEEMKKYFRRELIRQASRLVRQIDADGFGDYTAPGIRSQLLDVHSRALVQDFVVEGNEQSVHVLNAVSPAFTCSLPFAEYVVDRYVLKTEGT